MNLKSKILDINSIKPLFILDWNKDDYLYLLSHQNIQEFDLELNDLFISTLNSKFKVPVFK